MRINYTQMLGSPSSLSAGHTSKAIILVVLPRNLNVVLVVRIQANPKCNRAWPMIILKEECTRLKPHSIFTSHMPAATHSSLLRGILAHDGNRGQLFELKPLVAMITTHKGMEIAGELNTLTLLL
ncbi:uncharacterized protein A4U43_C02F11610 [Asparagus officinalis]|uniref:Uncharacterized protein n=1 Tax=Asparagus officinalis TaxID=4686 RepID=A0A5P1FKD2_ASPOF|nr:uncharacterized protein A4U43_C02F11610 [Asparagus officinalis]